jgi:hypothetical protein
MRLVQLLTAITALIGLVGCKSDSPDIRIHYRLAELAGKGAVDCGRAVTNEQNKQQSVCALEAFNAKQAFFVQYKTKGTDAISEVGIAFDSKGTLFSVGTISWSPLYGGHESGKYSTDICKVGSLRKLSDDELTCDFPPS